MEVRETQRKDSIMLTQIKSLTNQTKKEVWSTTSHPMCVLKSKLSQNSILRIYWDSLQEHYCSHSTIEICLKTLSNNLLMNLGKTTILFFFNLIDRNPSFLKKRLLEYQFQIILNKR
jgi:hypothetical protein